MKPSVRQVRQVRRVRLMLVDDHAVPPAGYTRLLEAEGDLDVDAEHGGGNAAHADLAFEAGQSVDVLVLDSSMSEGCGLDLSARVAGCWPTPRTLVFTMHDNAALVAQAMRAGAAGFVTKRSPPVEAVAALRRVVAGERGVPSAEVRGALDALAAVPPQVSLSARGFDLLCLPVKGKTLGEVAARLAWVRRRWRTARP